MKKVHVVLSGQSLFFSKGQLNASLAEVTKKVLETNNISYTFTNIAEPYDDKDEANIFVESDLVIFHFPLYWFSAPYILKQYLDMVLTGSYRLFLGKPTSAELYGTTGRMVGKRYGVFTTCHFQPVVFETGRFMEGKNMDDLLMWFDVSMRYIGMEKAFIKTYHDAIEREKEPLLKEHEQFITNVIKG